MGICSSQANKPGGSSLPSSPSEYSRNDHIIQPMENSSPSSGPTLGQLHAPSNSFSHPSTPHNSTPYSPPSSHPQPGSPATQSSSPQSAYQNCQSSKSDHSEIEKANNHPIRDDVKVHAVVTGELDHDHNQALRIPLGQVTDEQLVAELADRELSYDSRASQEYDAGEHDKAIKIPLEAVTNDELLFEVDRRRLTLYESIDQDLILETYEFGKELGKGASGVVYACRHYDTHGMYACKVIKKDTKMNDAQSMSTEIEIMKRLRHKNVVAMYELFESPVCLWMILELVDGGDLRSYLSKHRQTYTEAMAAQHLKQILSGVHYLHSMGVVHRDLKLENILLKRTENSYEVKIADFGLSALVRIGDAGYHNSRSSRRKLYSNLHEPWGTAEYESPELLNGAYGPQADMWAIGCMLYEMLSGSKAFYRREDEKNFDKLYSRIRKGEVDFRRSGWWSVSANAKNLITGMITVNPKDRLTATEALNHDWIRLHCRFEQQ